MKYLMSAEWWKAAGIRAVKTMCQTGAALVVTQLPGGSVDWVAVGSAAIVAGVASLGTSLAGLPELENSKKGKRKKSPTHQALSRCCPKTTTAIHSYNIPYEKKLCKRF